MKITRRYHSCVELSKGQSSLIIDPGAFQAPDNLAEVDAILVTHIHPDHVDVEALTDARRRNPRIAVYGPAQLAEHTGIEFTAVADGVAVQHHAVGAIGVDEANAIVFDIAEQRLGLEPGSLAKANPVPARGQWAGNPPR